jgi:large subunit ribosomal protein L32e
MAGTSFVVKESKFVSRVKRRWRFPRGKHSKVRQMHCGRPALPSVGYGAPRNKRGLQAGVKSIVVSNINQMRNVSGENVGAVIASTVSTRKKLELLDFAIKNNIKVLNVKDSKILVEKILKDLDERKKKRKSKQEDKTKKQKEKEKKAEEKKDDDKKKEGKKESNENVSLDEKQEAEKKAIEKTITKKQ